MTKKDNENENNTNTDGGSYTKGNVIVGEGDFIGRDKNITIQISLGIFAVVIVFVAVFAMFAPTLFRTNDAPTITPTSFIYQVSVQTKAGDPIPNASVRLEIGNGKAPLNTFADSAGLARIPLETSYMGKSAYLSVRATGYEKYEQNIDLAAGNLPQPVQLNPMP